MIKIHELLYAFINKVIHLRIKCKANIRCWRNTSTNKRHLYDRVKKKRVKKQNVCNLYSEKAM